MKRIEYIMNKQNLIQEINIKEIKYSGSNIENVDAHIFVFPRVLIYVSESEEDASYIFLTKEKMECFLAITFADYFSSEAVRKRADFDRNMNKFNSLFKRIVLKYISEEDWNEAMDFYTNRRVMDILGEEETYCLAKASKMYGLDVSNPKAEGSALDKLPFVNIQGNGVGWNELCFPAFVKDSRYNEVETNLPCYRAWYKEQIQKQLYRNFTKYSSKIKLCSYGNKYSHSDILLFKSMME